VRTAFTDLVGVEHPLVGFNRSPGVVAEVSKAGALGVLAATAYRPEELDAQLTWIEEQIGGRPYGVDLLIPAQLADGDATDLVASLRAQIPDEHIRFVEQLMTAYGVPSRQHHDAYVAAVNTNPSIVSELLDVAFSHRISLIASALGTPPAYLVERAKEAGVTVAALVGKRSHAERQLAAGVDLLIAQGTEAGGHTGTIATMILTPEIVDAAGEVPVLAAGGIASGRQMAAALALGAAGVWCGSVWLASEEDIAPAAVKAKLLVATSSDTLRSATRTGKPARQLRSAWHEEWEKPGAPKPLPMPLQSLPGGEAPQIRRNRGRRHGPWSFLHVWALVQPAWNRIDEAAEAGHEGALELESSFIGQVVGSFARLRPAAEITRALADECRVRLVELGRLAES
jgi:NAD(P)H-dependent flavin oxidoreductase YrpB (nitropropane dioxygenase family)